MLYFSPSEGVPAHYTTSSPPFFPFSRPSRPFSNTFSLWRRSEGLAVVPLFQRTSFALPRLGPILVIALVPRLKSRSRPFPFSPTPHWPLYASVSGPVNPSFLVGFFSNSADPVVVGLSAEQPLPDVFSKISDKPFSPGLFRRLAHSVVGFRAR